MRTGIYDEAQTLYGPVDQTFATLGQLHVQEIRLNLYWAGKYGVAKTRPAHPANSNDPAYNWTLYDRTVADAAHYGIHVLFSIYGTPSWANGGQGRQRGSAQTHRSAQLRRCGRRPLQRLVHGGPTGSAPQVREWLAWNEPNNPVFLTPQYKRTAKG